MEIGENVENNKNQKNPPASAASVCRTMHSTQSQPILLESEIQPQDEKTRKSSKNRRVSFASNQLAQYLEPINPFETFAVPVTSVEELSKLYQFSCEKHKTTPISAIIKHLENLDLEKTSANNRAESLNLRQQNLTHDSCEALEELFKRVKYRSIDLTQCSLDDISASSLFDMIEYYEACNELNISENSNIKNRGWQSCINMIKRSQALHSLATKGTTISDSNATALGNALMTSYIYTLKLENCGLKGRPILCLSGALQKNRVLKELCLANNELTHNDAFYIGNILKNNYHLQLLDISNNDIQDEGFRHLAEALSYQSVNFKTSSADSLSSSSMMQNKFDFTDFTANLNNINNNRNRFSPTPPPKTENVHLRNESASTLNINNNNINNSNNNNNSILQISDNDNKSNEPNDLSQQQQEQQQQIQLKDIQLDEKTIEDKSTVEEKIIGATTSTKKTTHDGINSSTTKFKYTTESLSPISHGYDDTTTNHQLFNSRSPERSFSSESLCSETSVESNDSKSSIRLIESKFSNRNGTLERQNHHSTSVGAFSSGGVEKQATGLQVLILWNNNLTSTCAASAADLFECTEYLQIINFGQNQIGNNFLMDTKSTLKSNMSLTSIGLQATNLSCDGLKTLSEILQFGGNSTLQRIDLRNNNLSTLGLGALSEALNSNKSIIRIDLDDAPKNEMLPLYEKNSEYQRLVSTIRQQCTFNENPPPDRQEAPKAASATSTNVQRMKRANFGSRKISLTCPSIKVSPKQQLLEPIKKQANNRLRSPSPTLSPSSPLTSPSRSRFQVSRVSESSSGVSSKSPSSSSSSPTFFPSNSRFRVITVAETPQKKVDSTPIPLKVLELKAEASKEIDIPAPKSTENSISSIVSSQSCEQLDYEIKRFIDLDSCSSFSSSIDSIDRQTDVSSTDSFDIVEKLPVIIKSDEGDTVDDKKDIFSNENTLTLSPSSSSSSSSNEGLTLTTNSPTEQSPKQDPHKRTRKASWIQSAIGGGNSKNNENSPSAYPATLDKLLNLFHHPTSIFTKTSPESTTVSSPSSNRPKITQAKEEKQQTGMGQKENSISGFIHSLVSLTHKKDDKITASESSILQNISPENTIGKNASNSQMLLESLPKSIKKELKENISPENTISCENFAGVEKQQQQQKTSPLNSTKVLFVVGDDASIDLPDSSADELSGIRTDDIIIDDVDVAFESHSLGDIARDSMTILKSVNDDESDEPR